MFTGLLRILDDNHPRTTSELAAELGADTAAVRLAFEHCERMGYLERVAVACGECCGSCGSAARECCATLSGEEAQTSSGSPSWWRVTERGRRAARITGGVASTC